MALKLPHPADIYNPIAEAQRAFLLEREDRFNRKTNTDIEVGSSRLILTSPNGTRYSITVSNLGIISATAL
jgi:hypothetical protein